MGLNRQLLAVLGFVALGVLVDRATASDRLSFHDARSPLAPLISVAAVAVVWRRRHQLTPPGRFGLLLCTAGIVSNLACLLTDPDGVSDYFQITAGGYLVAFNIADLAILAGMVIAITATLAARIRARHLETRGPLV